MSRPPNHITLAPSRRVTATFVAVFLIGTLVGALLYRGFQDVTVSDFFTHTSNPVTNAARINQKYVHDYHLSADEQARIAPLVREMTQRIYVTRRRFGVDIVATLDDYHRQIGAQMTPDHRAAYEKANDERRKRMSKFLLLDQPSLNPGQK